MVCHCGGCSALLNEEGWVMEWFVWLIIVVVVIAAAAVVAVVRRRRRRAGGVVAVSKGRQR
jgi:hypothetical protein